LVLLARRLRQSFIFEFSDIAPPHNGCDPARLAIIELRNCEGPAMNQLHSEHEQRFIDLAADLAREFAERAARYDEEASVLNLKYVE
jgi:hypothetical protein